MTNVKKLELPQVKTIVETTDKGTYNVWFKYENLSPQFVNDMRQNMESHIFDVHISGTQKKPIELPQDDVSNLIETLVNTVKMLDKESALAFIKANKDRTDTIGYLPLLWAAARCANMPDEAVINNVTAHPGCEKGLYESLVTQFQIPIV